MSDLQAGTFAPPPPPPAGCTETIAHHLRDWDWEAIRANGKLYLFCYVRDTVIALAPFDFVD